MKKLTTILFVFFCLTMNAQTKEKAQIVDVSCGQCQFGMKGKAGCDLATRIDGKSYFIDGAKMDQHGDAHAKDGMCTVVRKAEVVGEIKNDKFVVTSFKLLPMEQHKHSDHDGHKH